MIYCISDATDVDCIKQVIMMIESRRPVYGGIVVVAVDFEQVAESANTRLRRAADQSKRLDVVAKRRSFLEHVESVVSLLFDWCF